jgi:hypothetical protein
MSMTRNIGFDGSGTHVIRKMSHPPIRLADREFIVDDIALEESYCGRECWKVAIRKSRGGPFQRVVQGVNRWLNSLRDFVGGGVSH